MRRLSVEAPWYVSLVAIVCLVELEMLDYPRLMAFVLGIAAYAVFRACYAPYRMNRYFTMLWEQRREAMLYRQTKSILSPEAIEWHRESSSTRSAWTAFSAFHETENLVVLFTRPVEESVFYGRSQFSSPEEWNRVVTLVQSKLPSA